MTQADDKVNHFPLTADADVYIRKVQQMHNVQLAARVCMRSSAAVMSLDTDEGPFIITYSEAVTVSDQSK